jgi:C_GCAxxG_C_C family probable redox protein
MIKGLKSIFAKTGGKKPGSSTSADELAELAARRAENFFKEHRLSCSEAALLVVNLGFEGGLTTEQALCLGSGFGGGVGGSGCVCGALSGAVMALGLFLGPGCKNGLGKKKFRKLVAHFHDSFREKSGTVCCRDLIADFRKDRKGQALFCRGLTGRCTGEAVRIILQERPELAERANLEFLQGHDSGAAVVLQKLLGHRIGNTGNTDN